METCAAGECVNVGVFPGFYEGSDGEAHPGVFCFEHNPDTPAPAVEAEPDNFHVDVTAGLTAMILEHTAMTMRDTVDASDEAMRLLAENTGMTLDVAAGILLATTWIAAAGGVDDDMLLRGAELYETQADADAIDADAPADDELVGDVGDVLDDALGLADAIDADAGILDVETVGAIIGGNDPAPAPAVAVTTSEGATDNGK